MESFIREYQLADLSICDGLIDLLHKAVDAGLARPGIIGTNATVDPRFKKSTDFALGQAEKLGPPARFKLDAYLREISGFIESYLEDIRIMEHGGTFAMKNSPQIQWYKPGEGFYAWHIDGPHAQADRALVFTSYLNDVTDGGGTEFYHQKQVVEARKGRTAIFPAALTHVHRGVISTTQHKYLVTGWLNWT